MRIFSQNLHSFKIRYITLRKTLISELQVLKYLLCGQVEEHLSLWRILWAKNDTIVRESELFNARNARYEKVNPLHN